MSKLRLSTKTIFVYFTKRLANDWMNIVLLKHAHMVQHRTALTSQRPN